MADERRRIDDERIDELVEEMKSTRQDVRSIRDMLISEPEASPLGRSLLNKSVENRRIIDKHHEEFLTFRKEEFKPLYDWWNQSKGAWKFVLGVATVLSIVGSFFGIIAFFGPR